MAPQGVGNGVERVKLNERQIAGQQAPDAQGQGGELMEIDGLPCGCVAPTHALAAFRTLAACPLMRNAAQR